MRRYTCILCGKHFKTENSLDRHLRQVHHISLKNIDGYQLDTVIVIRVNSKMKSELRYLAKQSGLSLSDFIRVNLNQIIRNNYVKTW